MYNLHPINLHRLCTSLSAEDIFSHILYSASILPLPSFFSPQPVLFSTPPSLFVLFSFFPISSTLPFQLSLLGLSILSLRCWRFCKYLQDDLITQTCYFWARWWWIGHSVFFPVYNALLLKHSCNLVQHRSHPWNTAGWACNNARRRSMQVSLMSFHLPKV